jgi:hypothetical protein
MFEQSISTKNGVFTREIRLFGRKLFHQNSVDVLYAAFNRQPYCPDFTQLSAG